MKKGLTEMLFILDRSGSMSGLETETIGGYNGLIEKQRHVEGNAIVNTVLFDGEMNVIHNRVPLEKVKPLTENEYYARGCTALLDAVAKSVKHIRKVQKGLPEEEKPEHTIKFQPGIHPGQSETAGKTDAGKTQLGVHVPGSQHRCHQRSGTDRHLR